MSNSDVVVFPGQGAQPRDMRTLIEAHTPELVELLEAECGPEALDRTEELAAFRQPAFVATALAGWIRLQALVAGGDFEWAGDAPLAVAGHSLGELAALVAAGCLTPADALRVAHVRGRLYDEAAASGPHGEMLAVIGRRARELADGPAGEGLWLANDNSPVQIVVSGPADVVDRFAATAESAGLRVVPLIVGVPAHTPLLERYVPRLRAVLDSVPLQPPATEVWCTTTAAPMVDIRDEVAHGIVRRVRWRELLERLYANGARRFIDAGPGHIVAGLAHRTLRDVETPTVTDLEEVHA